MFILVRHAVAVPKQRWSGADQERPLSSRGRRQAENLVGLLAGQPVARLLSSPTVRCLQTLAPLSRELGVPVEPLDSLSVGARVADLLELLSSSDVEHAALCTHGETFAALSHAWSKSWKRESRALEVANTPKGGCWVIEDHNSTSASARYLGLAVAGPSLSAAAPVVSP